MSQRIRHWKQHWDPNTPMVFRKRLLVLGEQLEAGAPVTEEHIKTIGIGRLKRWWQADILAHGEHPTKLAGGEPELHVNSAALREGLESELEPNTSPDAERLTDSEYDALFTEPQAEKSKDASEEPEPEDAQPEG